MSGKAMALLVAAGLALPPPAHAATTVTTYQYNTDGAMTAVTTQTDLRNSTTTYLTWDNFFPDETDPTNGTVYAGNGNLLAVGPKPGTGTSLFSFDRRDRLTSFQASDKSASYGYRADGLMGSSSAADGNGFAFYYAGSGIANMRQTDTDLWSAQLGPVRYLDDGTEEVLLTPRKDVAATYDPADQTVRSYHYDAFGAEDDAPLSDRYELKDNPHRYAGAYRDPLWGGYYLKARWYDPELATFLSRDPLAGFHPYSYGDGNPVMNVDPSGMSSTSSNQFGKGVLRVLDAMFVAPVAQMFTKQFWIDLVTNKDQALTLLFAGVLVEGGMLVLEAKGAFAFLRGLSNTKRGLSQFVVDVVLNSAQAGTAAALSGGNAAEAFEGMAAPLFGLAITRYGLGVGARTHIMRGSDVAAKVTKYGGNHVLIFRSRRGGWSSPVMDSAKIGVYHDDLIAVSQNFSGKTEIVYGSKGHLGVTKGKYEKYSDAMKTTFEESDRSYQYIGKVRVGYIGKGHSSFFNKFEALNPRNHLRRVKTYPHLNEYQDVMPVSGELKNYNKLLNNCHYHVMASISELRRGPYAGAFSR